MRAQIDSIAGARGEGEQESSRRIKTEFMAQMDGVGKDVKTALLLCSFLSSRDLDGRWRFALFEISSERQARQIPSLFSSMIAVASIQALSLDVVGFVFRISDAISSLSNVGIRLACPGSDELPVPALLPIVGVAIAM